MNCHISCQDKRQKWVLAAISHLIRFCSCNYLTITMHYKTEAVYYFSLSFSLSLKNLSGKGIDTHFLSVSQITA